MSRAARLFILVAGLIFFVVLVLQAGVGGLIAALQHARWAFFAIVGVWAVVYVCNTIAWSALIGATVARRGRGGPHTHIPFLHAYAISVASFAINYATPFVALGGEPLKLAQAADWIGPDRAATSVVSFRVTHTLGQMIFWILALPIGFVLLPHTVATRLTLIATAIVLVIICCFLVLLFRHGFVVRALDALHHIPLLRRLAPRAERYRHTLEHIDAEMGDLTGDERPRLILAVVLEVVGRAIAMLEFYIVARTEGLQISYITAFLIGAISQLAIILFIFVPFELGSREGGITFAYSLLGLSPALGVYTGVITRLRELAWIGIGLTIAAGMRRADAAKAKAQTPARRPGISDRDR